MIISRVQIYTGEGKGKTTAAFGLAVRAAGRGQKVIVIQLLKGDSPSGEVILAKEKGLFEVESYGAERFCFDCDENAEHRAEAEKAVVRIEEALLSCDYDMVIADELVTAMHIGLLPEDRIISLIECRPANTEFVLTGRGATERLIASADLVTEMREVKHYFNDGLPAREGIEY